jgi:hypothetical protein
MLMARRLFAAVLAASWSAFAQFPQNVPDQPPLPEPAGRDKPDDAKLPNGKSRADAIAADEHKKAIAEADELVQTAQKLRDDLKTAGKFVVPVAAVRRTEEIEKLARRIRGRLRS